MFHFGVTEEELAAETATLVAELATVEAERAAIRDQINKLQAALAAQAVAQTRTTTIAPITTVTPTTPVGVTQVPVQSAPTIVTGTTISFEDVTKKIEEVTGYPWYYTAGGAFALLLLLRR